MDFDECSEYSAETGPAFVRLPEKRAAGEELGRRPPTEYRIRDFERTWYRVGIQHGGGLVLYYRESR